ncbi:MAG TPA: signal peptide peptidase SppA [Gemmataceae bacterium]|nr:signal peptide peptidase SppA [Gemmataceae bacterium]
MRRLLLTLGMLACLPLVGFADDKPAPDKKVEKKDNKKAKSDKPRIPVFRLKSPITELPDDDTFSLNPSAGITLKELVRRMKKAADDPAVKAVVILPEGGSLGLAQTEEVRQAMQQVRKAGKEIYAHADSLSMREYTLLCGASRLSVVPTGDLWLMGLAGESVYLRGLLNKLGVKPDFLTCGAYKSAAEVFMRTGPSPEAEKMQNWLFDGLYDTSIQLIARGRNLKPKEVRDLIDNGPYQAESAKKAGLIDAVEHRRGFEAMLKKKYGNEVVFDKKYGQKKQPKVDFSSPFAVFRVLGEILGEGKKKPSGKAAVGIVYVDGPIVLRGGSSAFLGDREARASSIRKALEEAARESSIKAVVLRVDSPGGSAVASEIILAATKRVKAKKPFVVSMGNVAGSGGYYVACGTDTIFADESTITGSIGVVGGKLATNAMFNKIGITFKPYQRGKNAAMLSSEKPFTPEERQRMQGWMDEIYDVFKGHVVAIRGKRLKKPIDDLAGGRVYTGRQALDLGLVDKIGTLRDAIDYVAAEAKLKDYDVRIVPEPKNALERLLEEAAGEQEEKPGLDAGGPRRPLARRSGSLVARAMPYLRDLDPERVALIVRALERLQLMQQEGAVLMMPELNIGR